MFTCFKNVLLLLRLQILHVFIMFMEVSMVFQPEQNSYLILNAFKKS